MVVIYYWPDGTWCMPWELEAYSHMSDDYGTLQVSLITAEEDIDFLVEQLVTFGE